MNINAHCLHNTDPDKRADAREAGYRLYRYRQWNERAEKLEAVANPGVSIRRDREFARAKADAALKLFERFVDARPWLRKEPN